jgi:hypothetical protein
LNQLLEAPPQLRHLAGVLQRLPPVAREDHVGAQPHGRRLTQPDNCPHTEVPVGLEDLAQTDDLLVRSLALGVRVVGAIVRQQILREEHDRAGGRRVGQKPSLCEMGLERFP